MITLKRIVEQTGYEGQYYDLGRDFSKFRRTIDGADEEVKKRFEQAIGSKLVGKRVRAQASRGYKQFVKQYEFDVVKINLDNYYDNYVVVAQDNTTPKPKEYFLKPGFKIEVLGPATGQPSPQKGGKPQEIPGQEKVPPMPIQPKEDPNSAQHQPMAQAPAGNTPSEQPVREASGGYFDAYSTDAIAEDIEQWLPSLLIKPETALRDFVKGLGWLKDLGRGTSVAMFDIKIPKEALNTELNADKMRQIFQLIYKSESTIDTKYDLVKMDFDKQKDEWQIRIKKTMTDKTYE